MPRPKEFDQATTLRDLEKGMGINRFSLYATFNSKHDLFLKALDRYCGCAGCYGSALIARG